MKLNPTYYVLCISLLAPLSLMSEDRASCRGWQFGAVDLEQDQVIPSPDQKYRVILGGFSDYDEHGRGLMRVFEGPKLLSKVTLKNLSAGVTLNWAPDSNAFFFMWSDAGAVGNYHVRVFRIGQSRVTELPTVRIAAREFAKRHSCKSRYNNLFALRWVEGSKSMLIAPAVYGTSDCEEMGLTIAYLVRTTDGKIVKRYSKSETDALFKACSPFMD